MSTDDVNKKYLLSDQTFNKLREAQKRINDVVDVTPSLRKLFDMILTDEAIETCIQHFIEQYQ